MRKVVILPKHFGGSFNTFGELTRDKGVRFVGLDVFDVEVGVGIGLVVKFLFSFALHKIA